MNRQDCLMYAQGLYQGPGVKVTAERDPDGGCRVGLNGFTIAWGVGWPACYGEMRRGADRRESAHREEMIRLEVVARAERAVNEQHARAS